MFVGYAVKDKVDSMIERFTESMREKLKFLLTHGTAAGNLLSFTIFSNFF